MASKRKARIPMMDWPAARLFTVKAAESVTDAEVKLRSTATSHILLGEELFREA